MDGGFAPFAGKAADKNAHSSFLFGAIDRPA
jgi:hypothetical protein